MALDIPRTGSIAFDRRCIERTPDLPIFLSAWLTPYASRYLIAASVRTMSTCQDQQTLQIASATVKGAESSRVQVLFQDMVDHWRASKIQVAGLIERPHSLADRRCNAGVLYDIANGRPFFRESVPRSDACHIDVAGAEAASKAILAQIFACDLVILSKFGKLEAAKRGLIRAFEAAIVLGKPLLTTVSNHHLAAWREFAADASVLDANPDALEEWWILIGSSTPIGRGS
jgi:nucleoside-triphosphatase THEP1